MDYLVRYRVPFHPPFLLYASPSGFEHIALIEHCYPAAWQRSIVSLLSKKNDPTYLKNWCKISLICADAKVFIRLLTDRFASGLSNWMLHCR